MLNIHNEVSRRSSSLSTMCWGCATREQRTYTSLSRRAHSLVRSASAQLSRPDSSPRNSVLYSPSAQRNPKPYHASARVSQQAQMHKHYDAPVINPAIQSLDKEEAQSKDVLSSNIRQKLRLWNQEHGIDPTLDFSEGDDVNELGETSNNFTRLGDVDNFRRPQEAAEDDRDELNSIVQAQTDELEDFDPQHRWLRKGDLVELEFPKSERESIIAVFVRRVGTMPPQSQFYTINGKWIHLNEKSIQYAIPGWMEAAMIDPIIPYLPDQEVNEDLMDRAQMFDLSVPREVSAPLVSRMLRFQRESEEVYRKHASTLDSAHDILAHVSDLKFGSLEQVASKLIGKSFQPGSLPAPALFTVRKALMRGGFAFGSDRRSHRLTGFIQIRSKEQVATVEKVRNWIREWQDELAAASASKKGPRFTGNAKHVNDFVVKIRALIEGDRKVHGATDAGRVAPSQSRFKITKTQEATKSERTVEFSDSDRELIKFMEGWACSNIFSGLPRVEALPPLILHATGMYQDFDLTQKTGFLFLQEIGVLLPYENRVRFDQHLLLPSSQHSKPLEQLMTNLIAMADKPDFVDSMSDLRKDWGSLPVFCIDGEGAHEIDDGISLEKDGDDHWLHVHIANPTAFFNRDHALAKMARHMTESIYMPERAFMMLPSWTTQRHFSLDKDRPCLTFSAKLDSEGETVEHKIVAGRIRNVVHVTPEVVSKAIGVFDARHEDKVLTVGGSVPIRAPKKTAKNLEPEHIGILKMMQRLAEKRHNKRRSAGGLFLDSHRPDLTVHNNWFRPGLGWDHPSRHRARYIVGEPAIQYRSKEFISWFSAGEGVSDILVQEMMLLACEVGAHWCAERNIPVIFRGTIAHPYAEDPDKYWREVMEPAMKKTGGEAPMHLAVEYLRSTGATILSTTPLAHRVLGLQHYSKVTSPLRRYGDMILHWQVEAALREEAKIGKSLIGSKREDYLPFKTAILDQISTALHPREMMIRRATRYAEDFWVSQLFFRAFHYGETTLPKIFQAYISQKPQTLVPEIAVTLKEYNQTATMLRPETCDLGDAKAGDWWEVEIAFVDCFYRKIVLKPLRLISRWE